MKSLIAAILLVLCVLPKAIEPKECQDLDIRNDVRSLQLLRNCTVVHGFLQLVLMDGPYNNFTGVSFPELREITGFLLLFRIFGLVNLGNLFPNLEAIRGETLFTDYALILYGLPDLVEVNLRNLLVIERGYVRIELCDKLCNLQAIDWSLITRQQSPSGNYIPISKNDPARCTNLTYSCQFCPMPGKCWSIRNCQKRIGDRFTTSLLGNCSDQCLGRCRETDKSARGCFVCKHVLDNGECVNECIPPRILNQFSHRCVTEDQCRRARRVVHNGECLIQCPKGFMINRENQTCTQCIERCDKECPGDIIEYISDAQEFKGCTIIRGNILIKMSSDVQNINEELEYHLGDIEEIVGRLQVFRSPALTSLSFFKNLKLIRGENLDLDDYSVHIHENPSLKKLIDFTNRDKLKILKGGITFHYNQKLCPSEIEYFRQNSIIGEPEKNNIPLSNGHREAGECEFVEIKSGYKNVSPTNVTFFWEPYKPNNTDGIVEGYIINYIETNRDDLNWFNSRESCSKYAWKAKIVEVEGDLSFDEDWQMYKYTLQDLKQMTKYAFYIQSYQKMFSTAISARSTVKFVTTPLETLSPPIVSTFLKGEDSINLLWRTSFKERPFINFFYVDVIRLPDFRRTLDARNYCKQPINTDPALQAKLRQIEYEEEISECNCDETLTEEDFINLQHESHDRHNILRLGDTTISCVNDPHHEICEAYANKRFKRDMHHFEKSFVLKENHTIDKRDIKSSPFYVNSYRIEKGSDNFTVPDLLPFHNYAFEFFACHSDTKCSPYFLHTDRTNPNLTTDNLPNDNVQVIFDGDKTVTLKFREPEMPNGATVGFKVEQMVMEKESQASTVHCLNLLEHEQNNYSFVVSDLQPNVYGFRVRTMSLALDSQWTEWKVVRVEDAEHHMKIVITLIVIFVISLAVSCSIYSYRTLNCFRKGEDTIYLMSDLQREADEPRVDETELLSVNSSVESSLNASVTG